MTAGPASLAERLAAAEAGARHGRLRFLPVDRACREAAEQGWFRVGVREDYPSAAWVRLRDAYLAAVEEADRLWELREAQRMKPWPQRSFKGEAPPCAVW